MQNTLKHILFNSFTILIVIVLLAPSVVKLGHAFEDHKHEICVDNSTEHFHTLDLECEFYKFKVNSNFIFNPLTINVLEVNSQKELIASHYTFLSKFQKLHFSLRGPPLYS